MRMAFKDFMRFQRFYEISKTFWGLVGNFFDSIPLPPLQHTHTSDTHPDPLQGDTDNLFARHKGLWLQRDVGTP